MLEDERLVPRRHHRLRDDARLHAATLKRNATVGVRRARVVAAANVARLVQVRAQFVRVRFCENEMRQSLDCALLVFLPSNTSVTRGDSMKTSFLCLNSNRAGPALGPATSLRFQRRRRAKSKVRGLKWYFASERKRRAYSYISDCFN